MSGYKFDPSKIARLDDPGRLDDLRPDVMWAALGRPSEARTIADIGAGTGMFAEQFAALAPDATVLALDVAPEMIDWMRDKRAALVESGRIIPMLSDESRLPLDDASIDVAVMINMHHELDDPDAMYRDVLRALRPDGRLLVVDWACRETPHGPPVAVRSSAARIAEVLAGAGFADVETHDELQFHSVLTARKVA
jgi:ubiquinone/menaquinone biosynthesis C-methylase UbiE